MARRALSRRAGKRRPSGTARDQVVAPLGEAAGRGAAPARAGIGRARG